MNRVILSFFIINLLSLTSSAQGLFEEAQKSASTFNRVNQIINGSVMSSFYASGSEDNSNIYFQSISSQFCLSANVDGGKYGNAYAKIRYRSGIEFGDKLNQLELREAYIDIFLGPITFKLGKQITAWGATSFINPSDQFSANDPTFRSPNIEDARIGNWAIQSILSINSSSSLELLYFPTYTPSVLLTKPFNFPDYINFQHDQIPDFELNNSAFAVKYDLRTTLLDVNFSYFNGYRNTPRISLDTVIIDPANYSIDQLSLVKTPYRIQNLGMNITIPVGSYLFRSELAWMDPLKMDQISTIPFSELIYAFEIEQNGQNINLIGGYYGKYLMDFNKTNVQALFLNNPSGDIMSQIPAGSIQNSSDISAFLINQLSAFNRLIEYQEKEYYHSIYSIISMSFSHEVLNFEIPVMYNLTARELTFMPSLKLKITDGLTFQLGAYCLIGKEESLYKHIGKALNAGFGILEFEF